MKNNLIKKGAVGLSLLVTMGLLLMGGLSYAEVTPTIFGRVIVESLGTPVPNLSVACNAYQQPTIYAQGRTDSNGNFVCVMAGVRPETREFGVSARSTIGPGFIDSGGAVFRGTLPLSGIELLVRLYVPDDFVRFQAGQEQFTDQEPVFLVASLPTEFPPLGQLLPSGSLDFIETDGAWGDVIALRSTISFQGQGVVRSGPITGLSVGTHYFTFLFRGTLPFVRQPQCVSDCRPLPRPAIPVQVVCSRNVCE